MIAASPQRRRTPATATTPTDAASFESSLAELVAIVGHELRSPLATLAAASELLIDGSGDNSVPAAAVRRQVQHLTWLFEASLRAAALVLDGCAASSPRADVREVVALIIDASADEPGGLGMSMTLAPEVGFAAIEPEALAVILNNLISNARKHSRGAMVDISAMRRASRVLICVDDDGRGVPVELRSRIFCPGARIGNGIGLGLYVARGLAEAFGGTIDVYSSHAGSRFVLDLPVATEVA